MKTYMDLNLKKVREACNLDFAHYTYGRGMCSCCYGPEDLPARYWRDGKVRKDDKFTYILFRNAENGSGTVKRTDEVANYTCIGYRCSNAQLHDACRMISEQLGSDYIVAVPDTDSYCAIIFTAEKLANYPNLRDGSHSFFQNGKESRDYDALTDSSADCIKNAIG